MPRLKSITVGIKTPFLNIQGSWELDENEQKAAWELYVELVTRIAVQEMKPGAGLLREALTSLYQIFRETRTILKTYGPGVALPKGHGKWSFGSIALTLLNSAIRPVLSKWHPLLMTYENTRGPGLSPAVYEAKWKHADELERVLVELHNTLKQYAMLLAKAAGVPPLH